MMTVNTLILLSMVSLGAGDILGDSEDALAPGPMMDDMDRGTRGNRGNIDLRDEPEKRHGAGILEWSVPLSNANGHPLSTPSLTDLDLNGTLEVVVASASDQVFALRPNGSYFWDKPYGDDVIDYLGQTPETTGLDYEPPPFLTSVTSKDIHLGNRSEIILGAKNGVLYLLSDGEKMHKMGFTTGQYFSTPCITDLEGAWNGNKDELEIVIPVNDVIGRGWLEAYENDAWFLMRKEVNSSTRSPIFANSIVASDLDGIPERGPNASTPGPGVELDTELVACYPGVPLSIFVRNGTSYEGNPIYDQKVIVRDFAILVFGTPAVGNITGGPECEIIVPYCKGYGNWTNWPGGIRCYNSTGSPMWDLPLAGKGSGVCTSPAVAVLDRGSEGPDRKIIVFGSDNGMVYAVDAEFHNILWEFDTGGRVLSSPAICNIDNDGELELVIGSDSGLVFCFDLDPSDGVDEGVNYPGDGPSQDVLWAYDTTVPIGISSPVIADIDLDKQLEVLIGDSNGTLYCISAGGRSLNGQVDWPEFHNDHNRTGFYYPPTILEPQLDFEISFLKLPSTDPLDPFIGYKWDMVLPGSENKYEIMVQNKGCLNDSYNISLSEPMEGSGWNWSFNETGSLNATVSLTSPFLVDEYGGISSTILTVMVRCPSNASAHQQMPISVMATSNRSEGGQMMDEVTKGDMLLIVVAAQSQFRFWTDEPVLYTDPSGAAEFILNISNTGNTDFIMFMLSASLSPSGWTISFPQEPIPVACGETISVRLTIKAYIYERAGTIYDLNVSCFPEGSNEQGSMVRLRVIVSQVFEFAAEVLEKGDIVVDPGRWKWTSINVSNHGNGDDVLKLYDNDLPQGWSLEFHENIIDPGQNGTIREPIEFALDHEGRLIIYGLLRAPQSAKSGWYKFNITIEGKGSSLKMVIEVFVELPNTIRITGPNGEGSISLALPVTGWREVLIGVSNIGKRWDLVGTSSSGIDMDLFGKGWSIEVLRIGRTSSPADRVATVDIRGPINISELDEGWEYVPADLPDNGTAMFGGLSLILGPNETAWFRLLFKAPGKDILHRFDRTDLTLAAVGRSGSSSTSMIISISVLYPDITFLSDPVISGRTAGSFLAGDTITVRSKLINTGDLPADDLNIVLIVDGIRSGDAEVTITRNGTDFYLVELLFEAVVGRHEIRVEIDPDNQIVESADQFMDGGENDNNVYETTINVEREKGPWSPNIWFMIILAAVIMVATASALIAVRSLTKHRRAGDAKGGQEE
ncbi:MAG: hypothetical protein MUC62_08580 [Candidatus Thermoplasmatota archaeon]|nr:hypothetical protein [Candidatus Thermoplasmatota archaeon]